MEEDDYVLLETLKDVCKERKINVRLDEQFIHELKLEYFRGLVRNWKDKIRVKKEELLSVPIKQLHYLAATAFANRILNKPSPASLIFEILRCAGMEDEKNFPNRYYFLEQLVKRGLVRVVQVSNSKNNVEKLYCPTEKGWRVVDGTEAFNKLIELKEKILGDGNVKRLMERYSKDEIEFEKEIPALLKNGRVVSESESGVKVMLHGGKTFINLSKEEIEKIDSIAKNLGRFTQTDLVKAANADFKVRAYLVYAYEKGWIDVVEKRGSRYIYERSMV